jgi:uncharacterized protein (DUF305 family)
MRYLLILLLASLVSLAAACGNDANDGAAASEPGTGDAAAMMDMNLDDESFLGAMIEHHEGAVEMAEIALEHAERDEIHQMARDIIDAQEAESIQMEQWLNDSYGSGGHADHGVAHDDMGMAMDIEVQEAEI